MRKSGVSFFRHFFVSFSFLPASSYTGITCHFPASTFPESQSRATAAVAKTRHGDPDSDAAAWTTEEYITALSARISYMVKLGKLPDVAISVFSNLWPGEKVPDRVEVIASRLMGSSARLNEWRRSAAH
jgi:hypothetical protein